MRATTLGAVASLAAAVAADETVLGVFIFGRHGDRLAKPTKILTPIGTQEVFEAGSFMRERYFPSDSEFHITGLNQTYQPTQLMAFAPDSDVLYKSATGFLQGMYPPLGTIDVSAATDSGSSLSNGTTESTPLDGYQYIFFTGVDPASPNNIWIQGDVNCPVYTNASTAYFDSPEFKTLNESTLDFYQSLLPVVEGSIAKSDLNYGNAYEIFDYFVANGVHNKTFAKLTENMEDTINQVRFLQDIYSKALNYNSSNLDTVIGGKTMSGFILSQLNITETTGAPFINYAAGSYDTFYQLFGLLGLFQDNATVANTFTGILKYAAAAVFELVESDSTKYIRFGFRNGTADTDEVNYFPILGSDSTMIKYSDFTSKLNETAISSLGSWCNACQAWDQANCQIFTPQYLNAAEHDFKVQTSKLSLADAGGIGAGVTLGVVLVAAGLGYLLFGRRSSKSSILTTVDSSASTAGKAEV